MERTSVLLDRSSVAGVGGEVLVAGVSGAGGGAIGRGGSLVDQRTGRRIAESGDGAAAVVDGSAELLDQAVSRDAGSFKRLARRFAQRHDPSAGGDLLKGQRNSRRGDLFVGGDGMGVLKGETDPVSFGLLEQAVDERKDHLWRRDGGRDGTPDAVRNNAQRTMDAIFELCTGRDALSHEPLPADDGPRGLRRLPPGQIVVVTAGVVDGTDPDGSCEIVGVGPVPPTVLDRISPDARIVGAIFGGDGQPLWLGRIQRLASVDQYLAVAIRDRGCVLCRNPMHRCRLHHVDEFVADEGRTDVENLVALCSNCHRWLHKNNRRAVRLVDSHGTVIWTTEARSPRSRDDDGPPKGGHSGPSGASRETLGRSEGKRRGRSADGGASAGDRQPVGGAGVAGRAPPFE